MRNVILIISLFTIHDLNLKCQGLSLGIGFELNQTRFRQSSPTVEAEFSNPHRADIGISANTSASLKIREKWLISLNPGISILKTDSDITSSNKASYANLHFNMGYYARKKIRLNTGIEYSYLVRLISTFQGQSADFTFFANHRHFINPTISISCDIDRNWSINFRFVYFLKDLFNSGALDKNGNIVGPVMVYPYTIGLGFGYNLQTGSTKN